MATLTIDIPNPVAARVADAFIAQRPPAQGVPVGTVAEKLAYVKSCIVADIKAVVRSYESTVAAQTAATKADAEVVPT